MNIIFKTVKTKNFMSFKELSFDFDGFRGQNVLIYGTNEDIKGDNTRSNGSGKSTVMNTLLFALYGDILNSVKMSHIRNWNCPPKEDVEVDLTMESNGVEYAISRVLRGKKGEQELKVFRRGADGEWENVTLSTIAETQRMIESDIVLCGKEGFLRCILLTADQNYNFFKLNKAAKNQFFESLFELTVYSDMYARLHRRTLDETAALTADSRSIDSLNENIQKLEQERENEKCNQIKIKEAKASVSKAKEELDRFITESRYESKIVELDESIKNRKMDMQHAIRRKFDEYDAENHILLDSRGFMVLDERSVDESVKMAVDEFDRNHGITKVDENGRIVFEEDPVYTSLVEKGRQLKQRVEKGTAMVGELDSEIRKLESDMSASSNHASNCSESIRSMKLTIKTHSKITDLLCDDCLGKYKESVDIQDFDDRIAALEKEIEKDNEHFEELKKKLDEKKILSDKYRNGVETLTKTLNDLRQKASDMLSERKGLQKERDMCIQNATNEIKMAFRERQSARNEFQSRTSLAEERAFLAFSDKVKVEKDELTTKKERLESNLRLAKYELKTLSELSDENFAAPIKTLTESLEATKKRFSEETEHLSHLKALEEILKPDNIRKSVVTDMLKELNFRICGYLSKMGSNYTCSFDEDFDATFTSSAGLETEYNNFSSGEKMRLGIACCLAFRDFMQVRLNLHPNILAIDEYIDSNLDPMAVNGIMDMIRYMVGTEKIAAFIISHRSEVMQDMFDSEIHIIKRNNESKMVVNGFSKEDTI